MLMSMHVTLCYQGNHILTGMCLEISISLQSNSKSFLVVFFKYLDHFMVVLFVLVLLKPNLDGFVLGFRKIQKSLTTYRGGRHSEKMTLFLPGLNRFNIWIQMWQSTVHLVYLPLVSAHGILFPC